MPDRLLKGQRVMWRRSSWITFAICIVGLVGVTLVAIRWGNPIPIQVGVHDLRGTILFGWLVAAISCLVVVPVYFAFHARAVVTPPELQQLGLGTVDAFSSVETSDATRPEAIPNFSRAVGVMTMEATHWGLAATFDGFSWGFRLRPSRIPLPFKRIVPTLTCRWTDIERVEEIDYRSLESVFVITLRDPPLRLGIGLGSIRSLAIVDYLRDHNVRIVFVDPERWGVHAANR